MKKNLTLLLAAVPFDTYKKMQCVFNTSLDDCYGVLEDQGEMEVWYGFINRIPIKVSYRLQDNKTQWKAHDLDYVKQKIKNASS